MSDHFIEFIRQGVSTYDSRWKAYDNTNNLAQKYEAEFVKEQLRPVVFEEIRLVR